MKTLRLIAALTTLNLLLGTSLSLAEPKCDNFNQKLNALSTQEHDLSVKLEFTPIEQRDAVLNQLLSVRAEIAKFKEKLEKCLAK
jgi:hypothetical protein